MKIFADPVFLVLALLGGIFVSLVAMNLDPVFGKDDLPAGFSVVGAIVLVFFVLLGRRHRVSRRP